MRRALIIGFLWFVLAVLSLASSVQAREKILPKGFIWCVSEATWKEAWKAILRDDTQWLISLEGQCFGAGEPLSVRVISQSGWTGVAKIRILIGDGRSVIAYTHWTFLK